MKDKPITLGIIFGVGFFLAALVAILWARPSGFSVGFWIGESALASVLVGILGSVAYVAVAEEWKQ